MDGEGRAGAVSDDTMARKPLFSASLSRTCDACPFSNKEINVQVYDGQVVWLRGPSGAGKTLCVVLHWPAVCSSAAACNLMLACRAVGHLPRVAAGHLTPDSLPIAPHIVVRSCLHLLGLNQAPGTTATVRWDASVPMSQRAGMLFQQGVLVDSLTVAENLLLSLSHSGHPFRDR